jgi:hypothetical protein
MLPGLILVILVGLFLNRIGFKGPAGSILIFTFMLFTVSLLYIGFRSLVQFRNNRFMSRLLFSLGLVLAFCSISLLIKFAKWEAAHISAMDYLGAIVFLIACIILFAAMPFSNFIEWTKRQKKFFFRLVLTPMVFFLIMFSLKFLLPGDSYQKMFFKGFSEKEKTFFGMDKYTLEEQEDTEREKD